MPTPADTDPTSAPPQASSSAGGDGAAPLRSRKETAPGMGPPLGTPPPEATAPPTVGAAGVPPSQVITEELPATPVAMLLEGTPVPPEATEALLTGLLRGENETYFHKAKSTAESAGEAAAAYATGPRAPAPGGATPPPQPPVLLRQSVELDIVRIQRAADSAPPAPTEPAWVPVPPEPPEPPEELERKRRANAPTALTLPLVVPVKGKGAERWVAFGVAALLAAVIGGAVLRWLTSSSAASGETREARETRETSASTGAAPSVASLPSPHGPTAAAVNAPTLPPPDPAPLSPPPAQPQGPEQAGDPASTAAAPAAPATATKTPAAQVAAPASVEPPPKSDVKRAL